jgi:hypothetical protein
MGKGEAGEAVCSASGTTAAVDSCYGPFGTCKKYRPGEVEAVVLCQWHAVTGRHPRGTRACSFKTQAMLDSWNDLGRLPAHPSSSTRRRERFCRRAPTAPKFVFIHTSYAHAVGHRPHTALIDLPARDIYAPARDG